MKNKDDEIVVNYKLEHDGATKGKTWSEVEDAVETTLPKKSGKNAVYSAVVSDLEPKTQYQPEVPRIYL